MVTKETNELNWMITTGIRIYENGSGWLGKCKKG
jgi:hypothetical protein